MEMLLIFFLEKAKNKKINKFELYTLVNKEIYGKEQLDIMVKNFRKRACENVDLRQIRSSLPCF